MKKANVLLTGILALMLCLNYSFGQTGQKAPINLKDTLPVDPNVVIGKLDNGMTYYIRKNKKPEDRVELRLAVNAGSVLENKSQLGLAHFCEHMCFNGTKTFPSNTMVDYMQKHGMTFGGDLNAYTSFDETVYKLQVPTDNKNFLDTALLILSEWAGYVTFDDKEIDKERGVITEEWRLGLGADNRMQKKYFPIIFKNSMYADRIPIGDINIIKNCPHDTLHAFYKSWYRPNLEGIMIVGDIDVKEMEAKVKELFGGIKNPANPRTRTVFDLPDNQEPLIGIATDKEATYSGVMMFYKHDAKIVRTLEDYRDQLKGKLFTEMLNARFEEITQKADAPFVMAESDYGSFLTRSKDAYQLFAMAKENQIEKSFEILLTENERVRQFGFTATELERIKDQMLSDYEKAAKEFDKTESKTLIVEYVDNFLSKDPIPGAKIEYKLAKKLLPDITIDEVNALTAKWITDNNLAIVVTAPEKESIKVPTEKQLTDIIAKVKKETLTAYIDNFKAEPLVKDDLKGSKIVSKKEIKDLDITELTFGNGVQAIIKKTDFKNDEILIKAYGLGGLSLYSDQDFMSGYFASDVINECGIGNFNNTELEKKLKGKEVELEPFIEDLKQGLNGKCSPKDFETLLQLTYLYCKAPRKDTAEYNAFMAKMKTQVQFLGSNPVYAFIDTLYKASTNNSPRTVVIPNKRILDKVNLDLLFKIYNERFANAGNFKFFIVGNINADSLSPMLEKYLGSLPSTGKADTWMDKEPKFPAGITDFEIKKGTEPKSMVGLVYDEYFDWNDNNRISLRMLQEVLKIKLVEVIREEMSGVYSPQVQIVKCDQYPKPEFKLMIMFGCSPKNISKLNKAVFSIINDLRTKGPTQIDLDKVKEELIREREVDLKTNKFWLNRLELFYFNKDDVKLITDYTNKVNALTIKDLLAFANKYFLKDHYLKVALIPEKKK